MCVGGGRVWGVKMSFFVEFCSFADIFHAWRTKYLGRDGEMWLSNWGLTDS